VIAVACSQRGCRSSVPLWLGASLAPAANRVAFSLFHLLVLGVHLCVVCYLASDALRQQLAINGHLKPGLWTEDKMKLRCRYATVSARGLCACVSEPWCASRRQLSCCIFFLRMVRRPCVGGRWLRLQLDPSKWPPGVFGSRNMVAVLEESVRAVLVRVPLQLPSARHPSVHGLYRGAGARVALGRARCPNLHSLQAQPACWSSLVQVLFAFAFGFSSRKRLVYCAAASTDLLVDLVSSHGSQAGHHALPSHPRHPSVGVG
jgi:hypothetical protein